MSLVETNGIKISSRHCKIAIGIIHFLAFGFGLKTKAVG